MSKTLYVSVSYMTDISLQILSEDCFRLFKVATENKIAINRVDHLDSPFDLKNNEVGLEISNNYIIGEAEYFLLDSISIPTPSHKQRLQPLQNFLKLIYKCPFVNEIKLYITTDDPENKPAFSNIICPVENLSDYLSSILFQAWDYSYICHITKS